MRAWIYDKFLLPLTTGWYNQVLTRLPEEAVLLDVGIGTAGALIGNAHTVRQKKLKVVGVDIDADYIRKAQLHIKRNDLSEHIDARLESIYDHTGGPYDGVYFSASFMLMPDPGAILKHIYPQLKPNGRIYFTQTFQERPSLMLEKVKPVLKKVTSIDFGTVTYEADFVKLVEDAGMEIVEMKTMSSRGPQSYRLVIGRPAQA